jgi:hypothetical protein
MQKLSAKKGGSSEQYKCLAVPSRTLAGLSRLRMGYLANIWGAMLLEPPPGVNANKTIKSF